MSADNEVDDLNLGPMAPSHLVMQDLASKSYKYYMDSLKTGGRSGVSGIFGSALDLFGPHDEPPEAETLDAGNIEAPTDMESAERAFALAGKVYILCLQDVSEFVDKCRNGDFGAAAKKQSASEVSEKRLSAAAKGLACNRIYLTAIEQLGSAPDWLKDFLMRSLAATDGIAPEPSFNHVLSVHGSTSRVKISKQAALDVCEQLRISEIGDPAWLYLCEQLMAGGDDRLALLRESLTIS